MKKLANEKPIVFVMMSGGVDSSVAAYLLRKQDHNVVGCFIKGYNLDGCQEKEAEDARRVAEYLNIPFYTIDLEKDYKKLVVDYTIKSYREGLTPNPDVMCNKKIKFGLFLKKALELGADYVATGHYIRIATSHWGIGDRKIKNKLNHIGYTLLAARDAQKDQSYFLWTLTQEQLKHCLFPIGNYLKSEVRKIAKRAGLPTAEKKDSQGICFLGKISMEEFLKKYIPVKKGAVLNMEGKRIGEHKGVYFYTIGQRHGIGIAGKKPYYVAEKDAKTNMIKVAEGSGDLGLYKKEAYLKAINWINGDVPKGKTEVLARLRYRQPLFDAIFYTDLGRLEFKRPQKFVAPGQSAVLYNKKGEMLGGGIII